MPYANISEIPSGVPEDKKEEWMKVFNAAYEYAGKKYSDKEKMESYAFATAWAQIKKLIDKEEEFQKAYIDDSIRKFIEIAWNTVYKDIDYPNRQETLNSLQNSARKFEVDLPEAEKFKISFSKTHIDPGLGIIYLIANRAGIIDQQNEQIDLMELRKGAIHYIKNSRKGDVNHNYQKSLEVVESLVFDEPIIEAVKSGKIVAGDWVVGMEAEDPELLRKAIAGEIKGASIAGSGRYEEVEEDEEEEEV
jgi:cation transport regulator ChaB